MLKGINPIITGDLLKVLCDMGHGDTISIVDANYPAHTMNKNVLTFSGNNTTDLLQSILELLPLDHIEKAPALIMDLEPEDKKDGMDDLEIWNEFDLLITKSYKKIVAKISRQDFYEKSKKSVAIIQTGEKRLYGDIILVKGVL